jgi:hypothetical protein
MAGVNGLCRVEREAYWREVLAGYADSGQTLKAYCERAGLPYAKCQWWKSELKRRDRRRPVVPVFAEVHSPAVAPDSGVPAIEIAVRGNRLIRVSPGFDASTLAAVVRVLEGVPPQGAAC